MPDGTIAAEARKGEALPSAKPPITGVCHKCGSQRVHRSRRHGLLEHIVALAGLRFRRCHERNSRVATFGNSVLLKNDVDSLLRKLGIFLLIVVAFLIVVGIVTWFSGRLASFSSEGQVPDAPWLA